MRAAGVAVCLGLMLAACTSTTGRTFPRPVPGTLENGGTTWTEAQVRYGVPDKTELVTRNDHLFTRAQYLYRSSGGAPLRPGLQPTRVLDLYFLNERLAGYAFESSWVADRTDFDPGKVKSILVGRTRAQAVIELLGEPGGYYGPSLVEAPAVQAMVYRYAEWPRGTREPDLRRSLLVDLDAGGLVLRVRYTATENAPVPAGR
jgi:hypothetical protein